MANPRSTKACCTIATASPFSLSLMAGLLFEACSSRAFLENPPARRGMSGPLCYRWQTAWDSAAHTLLRCKCVFVTTCIGSVFDPILPAFIERSDAGLPGTNSSVARSQTEISPNGDADRQRVAVLRAV